MKSKLKTIFIILFIGILTNLQAEVLVFETYQDFTNKKATKYDEFRGFMHVSGNFKLLIRHNNKKESVKLKKIWGFTVKDALFRVGTKKYHPVRVIKVGEFVYYENGFAHAKISDNDSESASFQWGYFTYISKSINSEIIPIHYLGPFKKFGREHPPAKEFVDCVRKGREYYETNIRFCLRKTGFLEEE